MKKYIVLLLAFHLLGFNANATTALEAHKATEKIIIDGVGDESSWNKAKWQPLDQLILGTMPSENDFKGKFKILWDNQQLHLLVEISDDVLFDQHANPLHFYWDDDCLEIFIDEDASGGNHQFSYNAFAYHIALDNQVVDIGPSHNSESPNFVLLNQHVNSLWKRSKNAPYTLTWELSVNVYDDSFDERKEAQQPVTLSLGKKLGFMLAYCDNDGSKEREHFIGSTDIKAVNGSKNLGYITADVFQQLTLIK